MNLMEKYRVKAQRINGFSLYRQMLDRIDKVYQWGDLDRLKAKFPNFIKDLESMELQLLDLIYSGKSCHGQVQKIESLISTALQELRDE